MKRIIFVFLLCLTQPLFADDSFSIIPNYDTYGGVNYKQSLINPKGDWGKLFVRNQPGFDIYLGWRFIPNWAVEFGYEWTAENPKTSVISNGSSLLGVPNNSGVDISMTGKVRFKSAHTDLNIFFPFSWGGEFSPEWIVTLGVMATKPAIDIQINPYNAATVAFGDKFATIEGKTKPIFRGGFGIQTILIESVGLRALWRFENTAAIRARYSPLVENHNTRELFKNSQSFAIGLFVKF